MPKDRTIFNAILIPYLNARGIGYIRVGAQEQGLMFKVHDTIYKTFPHSGKWTKGRRHHYGIDALIQDIDPWMGIDRSPVASTLVLSVEISHTGVKAKRIDIFRKLLCKILGGHNG